MKFEFIELHRFQFRITKMCHVFDISRSAYYAWRKRPKSIYEQVNERLLNRIKQIYHESRGIYGSPRVTAELHAQGFICGHNRVARLMRNNGLWAKRKRKFRVTTHSSHNLAVVPNLLGRKFVADFPNQVWVSDITYIRTAEGWLYLAAILDTYSRQIVGWSMNMSLSQELVINALKQAMGRRNPSPGLLFHSDRGLQYASEAVRELLKEREFIQSMCGKGNCYDNAIMESFFGSLKTEWVGSENYKTRSEARKSIFEYIEIFYNRVRRHSALGYLSPFDYERQTEIA